ncbi:hypothetical protein [Blastopirellula marina]|uniref:Uncharacterized protein n=1 Tax=Blastopirellula marina TaxID=124 RepID=A0A2S8GSH4_9BACT|nr:hypothetical protein [Blastopirellula marina]PQO47378.1 hypothetical protein C5Y93_04870 [Blastopirellula marina]
MQATFRYIGKSKAVIVDGERHEKREPFILTNAQRIETFRERKDFEEVKEKEERSSRKRGSVEEAVEPSPEEDANES